MKTVQEELGADFPADSAAEYAVDLVARTLLGLKKQWIRQVSDPNGEMIGGMYFADSIGEEIVWSTHRYNLEKSVAYSAAYRELLGLLDARYERNRDKDSAAVKKELAWRILASARTGKTKT